MLTYLLYFQHETLVHFYIHKHILCFTDANISLLVYTTVPVLEVMSLI